MGEATLSKRNFLFISTIIGLHTGFWLFAGRPPSCGLDALGLFTTAHTLAVTFALYTDFGFDALLASEIARQREHSIRLAGQFFSVKVVPALHQSKTTT